MSRQAWLAGASVGATTGLLTLEFPSLGWLVLAAFVVPALLSATRVAAISGLTVGFGGTWLALLGNSSASCRPPDCIAPDIAPWLAIGSGVLTTGIALTVALYVRIRSRRAP